jgi:predicted transcriptional regulator
MKKVLDLENRRKIFNLIYETPGLHLRELERQLKLSSPLILYHLRFLERYEIVTSIEERGYKRYYPSHYFDTSLTGDQDFIEFDKRKIPGHSEKRIVGLLREKIPLGIVLYILSSKKGLEHKKLYRFLNVPKSTLTYNLKKLINVGVVEKIESSDLKGFEIIDRKKIANLLIAYKPTKNLIEDYGKMWAELFGYFNE